MATGINYFTNVDLDYSDPEIMDDDVIEFDGIRFDPDEVLSARGVAHNYQQLYDEALWFYQDMDGEVAWSWDRLEILCQGYNELNLDPEDIDRDLTELVTNPDLDMDLAGMLEAEIQSVLTELDFATEAKYTAEDALNRM